MSQRPPLRRLGVPASLTDLEVRQRAVELARLGLGLDPGDEAYQEWCYPHDPPAVRRQLAPKQSGCALYARGVWYRLGVSAPELELPYGPRSGLAVADLVAIAHRHGAWVDCTRGLYGTPDPEPGDAVLIGDNAQGGLEHVFTVLAWDGDVLVSCDGGQPGVRERRRRLARLGEGTLWARSADQPSAGRRVMGYARLVDLPLGAPPALDEGPGAA